MKKPRFIDKSRTADDGAIPFRVESEYDSDDGSLNLFAVDAGGKRLPAGIIAWITRDGRLRLPLGVNGDLGLDLDGEGRIKILGEGE